MRTARQDFDSTTPHKGGVETELVIAGTEEDAEAAALTGTPEGSEAFTALVTVVADAVRAVETVPGTSPSTRTLRPGQAIRRSNSAVQLAKRNQPWLSVRPTSSGLGVPWMP
jgi:hypothetical protein